MEHNCCAVIVAAGRGRRMGGDIPKQFMKLDSDPIIIHTMKKFDSVKSIDHIIIVIAEEYIEYMEREVLDVYNFHKPVTLVEGARERQESVYNGLRALPENTDIVIIHDGVRPFVTRRLIEAAIAQASTSGAAVAGVPVKDTIKTVYRDGIICETLNRDILWNVQTPQVFKYDIILDAHRIAREDDFMGTDDSGLVERLGMDVKIIMGDYENIKITTMEDIYMARALLKDSRGVL